MTDFNADAWQSATPGEFEDKQPPPPGMYDVSVQAARAFTSKNGNDVMVVEFRVVAGALEGHTWDDVRGFKTAGAVKAAKAMAASLGVDADTVTSLDELNELLGAACGNYYEVEVRLNGSFTNTYVKQQVRPGDPGTSDLPNDFPVSGEPVSTGASDGIPF